MMRTDADKPLVWLHGEIKTPPMSKEARVEAGALLRRLQSGELLGLPHSRPMPSVGKRCHELRVDDGGHCWRIFYRLDPDAVVILDVIPKGTRKTPHQAIENCQRRLSHYEAAARAARKGKDHGQGEAQGS